MLTKSLNGCVNSGVSAEHLLFFQESGVLVQAKQRVLQCLASSNKLGNQVSNELP